MDTIKTKTGFQFNKFLDENKNSNERLMQKVLQSTDLLRRVVENQ